MLHLVYMRSFSLVTIAFLLLATFLNCGKSGNNSKYLSVNELKTTELLIDITKDTAIQTPEGAIISFPAGTLRSTTGSIVKLEIKEAYSLADMIKAGLLTQADGSPLSSGGMIYINATAGQQVSLSGKITVAIPTGFIDHKMQLYKGDIQRSGTVNWGNPQLLPENKQAASFETGQTLFQQKCSSCHGIGKSITAPDLAHFTKRFPIQDEANGVYYAHFSQQPTLPADTTNILTPFGFEHAAEIYKCNLFKNFNAVVGGNNTLLYDTAGVDIFRFIQNESDKNQLPLPEHAYLKAAADSCETYKVRRAALESLKAKTSAERAAYIQQNGTMAAEAKELSSGGSVNQAARGVRPTELGNMVSRGHLSATYYQFSIDSFGWFNIDMLLKESDGVQQSSLLVRVLGTWRQRINIYLIIPGMRVFVQGGQVPNESDTYAFTVDDGKIFLPQNVGAYVLALSEANEIMAFQLRQFITSTRQEINLTLEPSTKEAFDGALNQFRSIGLNINVAPAKHSAAIKLADAQMTTVQKEIEKLETFRPVTINCDCGVEPVDELFSLSSGNNK